MTEYKIPPHPDWSDAEKWVWEKICNGEIADFNIGKKYGGKLDPKKNEIWNDANQNAQKRVLTSIFLETILTKEPYKSALTRRGVRIIGAWFKEEVDLTNADIDHELCLVKSRFDYGLDFNYLKTSSLISLQGSTFKGKVSMDKMHVNSYLVMSDGAVFEGEVILIGAKVGGQLPMVGSTFKSKVNMANLRVNSDLFVSNGAVFEGEVILIGAKVDGQLAMGGSTFKGKVDMNSLEVDGSLLMHAAEIKKEGKTISIPTVFEGDVILIGAKVGGQLEMGGSTFKGKMNMDSLQVGSHLLMRNAKFETGEGIYLLVSQISGNLDISNSKKIPSLDLTGATIKGEFSLGSEMLPHAEFQKGATLTLRNTETGALQDLEKSWEGLKLELTGFTYKRLGGYAAGEKHSMATRGVDWMKGWLARQEHYSPQPYEQLAKVLRESGHKGKADDILFVKKDREWGEALGVNGFKYIWMYIQRETIGYGFRIHYLLRPVIFMVVLGVSILFLSKQGDFVSVAEGVSYTLDRLLPIINLDKKFLDIPLEGFPRYYFYFHQIIGWFLASILIAGLSGITKK